MIIEEVGGRNNTICHSINSTLTIDNVLSLTYIDVYHQQCDAVMNINIYDIFLLQALESTYDEESLPIGDILLGIQYMNRESTLSWYQSNIKTNNRNVFEGWTRRHHEDVDL